MKLIRSGLKHRVPHPGSEENFEEITHDIADDKQVVRDRAAAKTMSMLLMACIAAGPLGLAVGGWALWQEQHRPRTVTAVKTVDLSGERAVVSELGQRVVVAWLTSSPTDHKELSTLVSDAPTSQLPRVPFVVEQPQVANISSTSPHLWSVTVAATVTDAAQMKARRYFAVTVIVTNPATSTVVVPTLPSAVAGPVPGDGLKDAYPQSVGSTDSIAQAATQFLDAYLTASADVGRYVAPGATVPVPAAMFTSVSVGSVRAQQQIPKQTPADGAQARILVSATGKVTEQQTLPLVYTLTMKARAGRWEVAAVDATGAYQVPSASAAPTTRPADGQTVTASPTPLGSSGSPTAASSGSTPTFQHTNN